MRLSSFGLRKQMLDFCGKRLCYFALEQLTRHAPDLLKAYIETIGPEKDYVTLVPAYAHQLLSIVGNSATVVALSTENYDEDFIGLEVMSRFSHLGVAGSSPGHDNLGKPFLPTEISL